MYFNRWLTHGLLLLALTLLAPVHAAAPDAETALPDITARPWTGDLDGMLQRRLVRILVPYSKTFYFNDQGTQRGLVYDIGQVLEEQLNAQQRGPRVHVIYIPVTPASVMQGFSWWDVPPAAVSGVPTVRAARAAYGRAKKRQQFYY